MSCERCPRLRKYAREVTNNRPQRFANQDYWARPVPGFGDPNAELLVIGLAPARTGALRTGRIFTGDSSSRFLVRCLHKAGFANQPVSDSIDDGLIYSNCYVTAAVKCAPPGDRPSRSEFDRCGPYLDDEIKLMKRARVVLALGSLALRAVVESERRRGNPLKRVKFAHRAQYDISGGRLLVASYHPSPRNTNTGKLTQAMLTGVLLSIRDSLESRHQ